MAKEKYIAPALSVADLDRQLSSIMKNPGRPFYMAVAIFLAMIIFGIYCLFIQVVKGPAVTGLNHPVAWGIYRTSFVFWIGIAQSGMLISAALYFFRSRWRSSINRMAEAMALFAAIMAGVFALVYLGRIWYAHWLLPYPNTRSLWVNFRSPLSWDVLGVFAIITVSSQLFFTGMMPDMAFLRDKFAGRWEKVYAIFAMGWRGTQKQWHHFRSAYVVLAALAALLAIPIHNIISWDFTMSILPGWHNTMLAPHFIAGAIFSGAAMLIVMLYLLRKIFHMESLVTENHFTSLAHIMLIASLVITYSYLTEWFTAWYSNTVFEREALFQRAFGFYAPYFFLTILCNSLIPLSIFFRNIRTDVNILFFISISAVIGVWLERFVIIASSLALNYEPYTWGNYSPSYIEWGIVLGSLAGFLLLFFLFVKFFPVVVVSEVKGRLYEHYEGDKHDEN